jgi:hypothetical protein
MRTQKARPKRATRPLKRLQTRRLRTVFPGEIHNRCGGTQLFEPDCETVIVNGLESVVCSRCGDRLMPIGIPNRPADFPKVHPQRRLDA